MPAQETNISPIRILHVGVGVRGRHWLQYVAAHPDTLSVACVDPDAQNLAKARAVLATRPCQYFAELPEALQAAHAEAAIIASPSALHAEHARRALAAGLAVMIEKPFATTLPEASDTLRVAESVGKPVMVAENYRYWPAERTIRQLVGRDLIGRIGSLTVVDRRNQPSRTEGPWTANMEYPQLQEIAIHHFDSIRSYSGWQPISIAARVWNPAWSDYGHGACTTAFIEMAGGVPVHYVGTLTSPRSSYSLWMEGERGVLWTNRKHVFWRPRGSRFFRPVRRVAVPKGDEAKYPKGGTTSLLNGLRDAVRLGQVPETSGYDNIWSLAMVEAGKLSDRARRTVSIDEVLNSAMIGAARSRPRP